MTTVSWRLTDLEQHLDKSRKILSSVLPITLNNTGEESVEQIRALLGLQELVTNVNILNRGQISNLPMDIVGKTNAVFRTPVFAGPIPYVWLRTNLPGGFGS